jgi:hypothetical protein
MSKLLLRFWAGFVGAVAGACIGLVAVLILLTLKVSLNVALWGVVILATIGALVGLAFGNKTIGGK